MWRGAGEGPTFDLKIAAATVRSGIRPIGHKDQHNSSNTSDDAPDQVLLHHIYGCVRRQRRRDERGTAPAARRAAPALGQAARRPAAGCWLLHGARPGPAVGRVPPAASLSSSFRRSGVRSGMLLAAAGGSPRPACPPGVLLRRRRLCHPPPACAGCACRCFMHGGATPHLEAQTHTPRPPPSCSPNPDEEPRRPCGAGGVPRRPATTTKNRRRPATIKRQYGLRFGYYLELKVKECSWLQSADTP